MLPILILYLSGNLKSTDLSGLGDDWRMPYVMLGSFILTFLFSMGCQACRIAREVEASPDDL